VISRRRGLMILYHGTLNALAGAVAFFVIYRGNEQNLPAARTATFCTMAFCQLMFSFGCRSERYVLAQLGFFSNRWLLGAIATSALMQVAAVTIPVLKPVFRVQAEVFSWEWLMIAALALMPVTFIEVAKLIRIKRFRSPAGVRTG
jgi:Ca2+-transporting ATPase